MVGRRTDARAARLRPLLEHAAKTVVIATLTVVADNARALTFYEKWGFGRYGLELCSIKLENGETLDEVLMARKF